MRKEIVSTNLRLNLAKEADRLAWDYLQKLGSKANKSYTQIIITAVIEYYDRHERLLTDPYFETREKEDAFLQRIQDAVAKGQQDAATLGVNAGLLNLLQGATVPPSPTPSAADAKREEWIDVALAFADGF